MRHPQIIDLRQRLGVEADVFGRHIGRIKHQVRRENASAVLGDGAQAVVARHHVEESRLAGVLVAAFLISGGNVCLDVCLRLAACAQLFRVQVDEQKSAAAFSIEALRINGCFCRLYETPANETAEAIGAFARFLVAFGTQNVNCSLARYLGGAALSASVICC